MRRMPLRFVVAAAGLVAVTVVTVVYLYQGFLGGSVSQRPATVTVELAETGGLFESSGVTYRGVRVGRVESIRTTVDGVEAVLSIAPGHDVPASSRAVVRTLSPAGEQFIDFQPEAHDEPFFDDGDTVEVARTVTPVSVSDSLAAIEGLMSQVDPGHLAITLDELSVAFADIDDLGTIITTGSSVLNALDALWPETQRVLRNGNTVLRTGVAVGDDLRQFTASAQGLAAWLREYDPSLRANIDAIPAQTDELREFTSLVGLKLPAMLGEMIEFTDLAIPYEPHLRQTLQDLPGGFSRFAGAFVDGRLQTNMFIADSLVCSYGNPQATPTHVERLPIDPDLGCSPDFVRQQRGTAHAPGPVPR